MAARNPDTTTSNTEFHASKPRDEPLTTHGHKPGILLGNESAPEFSAQTLPPGTAPKDRTFTPNPDPSLQGIDPSSESGGGAGGSAQDSLPGATSGDVHTGLGKPLQGQTSSEEGEEVRGGELLGVGASGAKSGYQNV